MTSPEEYDQREFDVEPVDPEPDGDFRHDGES